jgi:hypothetical protein
MTVSVVELSLSPADPEAPPSAGPRYLELTLAPLPVPNRAPRVMPHGVERHRRDLNAVVSETLRFFFCSGRGNWAGKRGAPHARWEHHGPHAASVELDSHASTPDVPGTLAIHSASGGGRHAKEQLRTYSLSTVRVAGPISGPNKLDTRDSPGVFQALDARLYPFVFPAPLEGINVLSAPTFTK